MKELDVTKPYRRRSGIFTDAQFTFIAETVVDGERVIISKVSTGDHEQVYICNPEDLENIPEKPEFSWDKPIRCKDNRYKVIKTDGYSALLEYRDGSRKWRDYYEDGRYNRNVDFYFDLENYEPEEVVRIERLPFLGIHNWRVHYGKEQLGAKIADFPSKEDAELFKRAKEQGL